MNDEMTALSLDDSFNFSCTKDLSCFNECCRDLNQFLTPYDILRLKKSLGITSTEFLSKYTSQHYGPESGLPVITLKTDSVNNFRCPFSTSDGCSVYNDRPSSCRIYPLARAITRSRETGQINVHYMIINESHCKGFEQQETQTVKEWIKKQELAEYNEANDALMEIISLKNQFKPGQMDIKSSRMFNLACYDLDAFRICVFEEGLLDDLYSANDIPKAAKISDTELLKLGFEWIRKTFFV